MKKADAQDGVVFHAGFPNAGEDSYGQLSLDRLAVAHPASTFFWRLEGTGIPELQWAPGSIVVVDRALAPRVNDMVVVVIEEEFVVRKILQGQRLARPDGEMEREGDVRLWGVVTSVLLRYRS